MAPITEFLGADPLHILGYLAQSQTGDLNPSQRNAWLAQIDLLKRSIPPDIIGVVCFEFVIPRIGKRADNVLLIGDHVVVIEFKIGAELFEKAAQIQVVDYALDLKNFHMASHDAIIAPILVATHAPSQTRMLALPDHGVYPAILANHRSLAEVLVDLKRCAGPARIPHQDWLNAGYRPTPTIIEASQVLYRGHQVTEITHTEAGAENLGATTQAIGRIIDQTRLAGDKAICFVSGVPGAGKTLAGLNLVCQRRRHDEDEHAVFLSGNGPLVKVLQEALTRDDVLRAAERGERLNKTEAGRKAIAFIQNIHHFRDESLLNDKPPVERVVVFDEAQRAWDREQTSKFMRQKRGRPDFNQSEPAFLISVMDRHDTWTVIVCLVGGGQEINTGEAGLEEWLRSLRDRFPTWRIYLPDRLAEVGHLPGFPLSSLGARVVQDPALHLGVSLRSFRSEKLAAGITALLGGNAAVAGDVLAAIQPHYPIVITRSLAAAKAWVRQRSRGSERFGLLASSGAKRLKPLGITMDLPVEPCAWFLNDASDVRSSYYLEDAASEFDVQGLELDWAIVAWDGDFIHQEDGGWRFRSFKGTRWLSIHDEAARRYRLNAYRVLLTRARQGMVILVPEGDVADPTRSPTFYDPTWKFLCAAGLPRIDSMQSQKLVPQS